MTDTQQVQVGDQPRTITVRYPREYLEGAKSFVSGANCPDHYTEDQKMHWYNGYWGDDELQYEVCP